MALQSSGTSISLGQIATEFGKSGPISLGSFRAADSNYGGVNIPTYDSGIPTSGSISLSNFYNKRRTIIMDLYSGSTETNINLRDRYVNRTNTFVSGGGTAPSNSSGSRVYAIINKTIGASSTSYNAVTTGSWDSNTDLRIYVNSQGEIYGAGGAGGRGGNGNTSGGCKGTEGGTPGGNGTTGIYVNYPCSIINNGYIQCGFGGGGGGASAWDNPDKNTNDPINTGGGGGGGAGFNSSAGAGGTGACGAGCNGYPGSAGTLKNGGAGGGGRECRQAGGSYSGGGGNGGGLSFFFAGAGGTGSGNVQAPGGGSAGSPGGAIIRDSSSTIVNYSGSGSLVGDYNYNYVVGINANRFQYAGGSVGQQLNYCGGGYNSSPCPGDCGVPFTPGWSGEVFATGGSGANLSFFIYRDYVYTSSGNATYGYTGYGSYVNGYYCTWNYRYTLYLARRGYGYSTNDTIYVSYDGRTFVFKPSSIGVS